MSEETLPACAALTEACRGAGLHPVGTTCDGGVICDDTLEGARAAERFGGRPVPLGRKTIVYGARS